MRNAYLSTLYNLAKKDNRIIALVADNGAIVYDKYRRDFSSRFFNVGIAEANMISIAAGLSSCGKIPFVYTIASFITMRAFEQIRNDVCLQRMNVKIVGIGAGLVYSNLGPTHQATEDAALMMSLPNITIFSPADSIETEKATIAAAKINGPVYLRLANNCTSPLYKRETYEFAIGRGIILTEGTDITVISTGNIIHEIKEAVTSAKKLGISVRLINMPTLKPLDEDLILKAAAETKTILTVEEHILQGGLGSYVAAILLEKYKKPVKFKRLGLNNCFSSGYGTYADIKKTNNLSKETIIKEIQFLCQTKHQKEFS